MGIICLSTAGVKQHHVFNKPIVDSRHVPGSTIDSVKYGSHPCGSGYTLYPQVLLEGYPFKVVKPATFGASKDLIAWGNLKPPSAVVLRGAPVGGTRGDVNHERDFDRISTRDHRGSGSATLTVRNGSGASCCSLGEIMVPPKRMQQSIGF